MFIGGLSVGLYLIEPIKQERIFDNRHECDLNISSDIRCRIDTPNIVVYFLLGLGLLIL